MAYDLHELLDIPLDKFRDSTRKNIYLKPKTGKKIIDAIIQVISEALQREEEVKINGFGVFKIEELKGRHTGPILLNNGWCNPIARSTTSTPLPPRKIVVFYPSLHLEAMVNLKPGDVPNYNQRRAMRTWN